MADQQAGPDPDYEDQDAEPTMQAPEEGRPDGHVAEDDESSEQDDDETEADRA